MEIARYAVVPLSPNSGLIGWVPNCDTLHALVREHRETHKVPLNLEHKMMIGMAPDYDHLPLMAKVEVFEHALASSPGDDLARILWLKSRSSEVWLNRRTQYTRSLAVMSVVGYLLGLGDRHPSNLMLDRYSGKILHIDFGDCFECAARAPASGPASSPRKRAQRHAPLPSHNCGCSAVAPSAQVLSLLTALCSLSSPFFPPGRV